MDFEYKVCILAAGVGSRMGEVTDHINKSLLPINFKAVISHIIEKFDKRVEIVVAVGHQKDTVIDYLSVAHNDRNITIVEVDHYIGPGAGPGYSLLQCKEHLLCPFIFFASDTLVLEEIPPPDKNWFGVAKVDKAEEYCTVKIKNKLVTQLDDKVKTNNKDAFIGLAGIRDFRLFFEALKNDGELKSGEVQVSNGFNGLIEHKLKAVEFTWFDTGTRDKYIKTSENFLGGSQEFDFGKSDEFLYFVGKKVIKYFRDSDVVKKRLERSLILEGLCPVVDISKSNYYAYTKVEGKVLYDVLNTAVLDRFLEWSKLNLWKEFELDESGTAGFKKACKLFYYNKTISRVKKYFEKYNIEDSESIINGVEVPSLDSLIDRVDWGYLSDGVASGFHGDLQFDNILMNNDRFILLDWRQDFSGITRYGDIYYDLAKLNGGMLLSYKLIKRGEFSYEMSDKEVFYKYFVTSDLIDAKNIYNDFILREGFDLKKVELITSLIFLSMCPMHNDPFDHLLYNLGKYRLYNSIASFGW